MQTGVDLGRAATGRATASASASASHASTAAGRLGARDRDCEVLALVGQRLRHGRPAEHVADLEQRDVRVAMRLVVGDRLQQAGQQRRAQHRLVGDQRVRDRDGLVGEPGPRRGRPGARNGIGIASAKPKPDQHVAGAGGVLPARALSAPKCDGRRHDRADAVVAVGARRPLRSRRSPSTSRSRHDGMDTSWSSPDGRRRRSRSGSRQLADVVARAATCRAGALTRAVRTRTGGRSGSWPRTSTVPCGHASRPRRRAARRSGPARGR